MSELDKSMIKRGKIWGMFGLTSAVLLKLLLLKRSEMSRVLIKTIQTWVFDLWENIANQARFRLSFSYRVVGGGGGANPSFPHFSPSPNPNFLHV